MPTRSGGGERERAGFSSSPIFFSDIAIDDSEGVQGFPFDGRIDPIRCSCRMDGKREAWGSDRLMNDDDYDYDYEQRGLPTMKTTDDHEDDPRQ
jgi:hypothetical protein